MICRDCKNALPDLLLDPAASSNAPARSHVDACVECRAELESLQVTFALLDAWKAPEPSPYFDQRLAVRLREQQAAPPAGFFERMRARLLFNSDRQLRPAFAAAMVFVLLLGGGTIVDLKLQATHPEASATVTDLQIFDKNDQAIQTMDQLLQDEAPADDSQMQPIT